jgi:hypothetical protein
MVIPSIISIPVSKGTTRNAIITKIGINTIPDAVGFPFACCDCAANSLPLSTGNFLNIFGRRNIINPKAKYNPVIIRNKWDVNNLKGPKYSLSISPKYGINYYAPLVDISDFI